MVAFPGLNVDPTRPPLDPESHLILRQLVLYVAHNDDFAPEVEELATIARLDAGTVRRRLLDLESAGLARFSGSSWYPATPGVTIPPLDPRPRVEAPSAGR